MSFVQPMKSRICFPNNNPDNVNIKLIAKAIATACSAELSAFTLSFDPMNLAIDAVTPFPRPKERPITKKKIGILKATEAIASPPSLPMKIISIIVYNV